MGFRILTYALPLFQGCEKDLIVKVPRQAKIELTAGKSKYDVRRESPKGIMMQPVDNRIYFRFVLSHNLANLSSVCLNCYIVAVEALHLTFMLVIEIDNT